MKRLLGRFRGLLPAFLVLILAAAAAPAQPAVSITSADGANQVTVHGGVQLDFRTFLNGDHPLLPEVFALRRARIYLDATLYRWIGFRLAPDFADGKLTLFDAYLEARFSKALLLRAGKFKAPLGLERLQAGPDLRFAERAFPTLVAPNRDIGISVSGDLAGGHLSYATALTNGVPDGASADTDGDGNKDVTGRVMVQPWTAASAARRGALSVGLAGSWGRAHGTPALPGLPVLTTSGLAATLFRFRSGATPDLAVVADGRRVRLSPQATYYRGPVGLMAEYIRSTEDVARGAARATFHAAAWQIAGSWVVTGEASSYRGVVPRRPLAPGTGEWGAVELSARYTDLGVGGAVFPVFADPTTAIRGAGASGLAATWYWNPAVKVVADYQRVTFRGGSASGNRAVEHQFVTRLQIWF